MLTRDIYQIIGILNGLIKISLSLAKIISISVEENVRDRFFKLLENLFVQLNY
jgi:hypothetical protein